MGVRARALVAVAAMAAMTAGCVAPLMDGAAGLVASGATRPSEVQIRNAFAFHRSQPSYLREFYDPSSDPIYGSAPLGSGRVRY
jgi:hypothetical protein